MKERLKIAKKFRVSRKRFRKNPNHRLIVSKCYHSYIRQCIFKKKDTFTLYFGSYYVQSFRQRVLDWCQYVLDCIYRFFLIHFMPNNDKTLKTYELIHYKVDKPFHLKFAYSVDEFFLESYLKKMGFKVSDEKICSLSTTYEIVKS